VRVHSTVKQVSS